MDADSMLIVEDDPASARMLSVLLATEHMAGVRIAYSAEEALAIIGTAPIRLLFVDLLLPQMSGLALVERLKANGSTCDVVAIAVTVCDAAGIEDDARRSGCAGFVRKPIDFDTLLRIVRASLGEPAARGSHPVVPRPD